MTNTEWILLAVAIVVVLAILLLLMRRKPADTTHIGVSATAPVTGSSAGNASLAQEEDASPALAADPVPDAEPTVLPPVPLVAEAPIVQSPIVDTTLPLPAATPATSGPSEQADNAARPVGGDNFLSMKGIGPKLAALLRNEGVSSFAQIAAWTDAVLAAIDAKLGSFAGRPRRDNWVDQARLLAAGDTAGFEAKYGKL